jgi:hypothetical protein
MITTCFGQYNYHQVLKYLVGKLLLFIVLLLRVWSLRCARVSVIYLEINISILKLASVCM